MRNFMQFIVVLVGILFLSHAVAAEKVVVIPLNSSKVSGVTSSDFYGRQANVSVSSGDSYPTAQVSCDSGDYVTGGGFYIAGIFAEIAKIQIYDNSPYSDRSGWAVQAINNGGDGLTLYVRITCANVSQ